MNCFFKCQLVLLSLFLLRIKKLNHVSIRVLKDYILLKTVLLFCSFYAARFLPILSKYTFKPSFRLVFSLENLAYLSAFVRRYANYLFLRSI